MIERGDLDYVADGIEPDLESYLGDMYGINTGQYMVRPSLQLDYLALNCSRPLFSRSAVRRAFNYAVDRPGILAARGAYAGVLTNHIIPPGLPGYREFDGYPLLEPDYRKAQSMLPSNFSARHPAVIYTWNALAGPKIGHIIAENLRALGISSVVRQFSDTEMFWHLSRRDEPFDIGVSGATADYPDPYVFINSLLEGTSISAENNSNDCYFNNLKFNARMKHAATLDGEARAQAYADLDAEIMSEEAPMVPCDNNTRRDFVGARVSGAFQHGLYSVDLCALRLEDVPRMVVAGRGE
jgi:ABC-type transport system substrate-binding protein